MKISPVTVIVKLLEYLVFAALFLLEAAIAAWIWRAVMMPNFGLPVLNFWEMYGLIWLSRLMLGSFGNDTSYNFVSLKDEDEDENAD